MTIRKKYNPDTTNKPQSKPHWNENPNRAGKENHGILQVTLKAFENLLCLPEGFSLIGIYFDPVNQQVLLKLQSKEIPATVEGQTLPGIFIVWQQETKMVEDTAFTHVKSAYQGIYPLPYYLCAVNGFSEDGN